MPKAVTITAIAPAAGRGTVTRITQARSAFRRRESAIARARSARRQLRPRSERFAHLTRMHD
jgi:hypothetical protein